MLQQARTGNVSILCHMPDDQHRRAGSLGIPQQPCRAFPHLSHTARRRFQIACVHGLDRIDDQEPRFFMFGLKQDIANLRSGHNQKRISAGPQTAGPHGSLLFRLFAGNIQNLDLFLAETHGHVQQDRGFADTGVAAQQHKAPGNDPPAQHPVKFVDAGFHTADGFGRDAADSPGPGVFGKMDIPLLFRFGFQLFAERVPRSAFRAFPQPGSRHIAAVLADIAYLCLCFSHSSVPLAPAPCFLFQPLSYGKS